MKRFAALLCLLVGLAIATPAAKAQASLVAIPSATQHKTTLNWTNNCTAASSVTCSFQVYRAAGTCPAAGAIAWLQLNVTAANAESYVDLAVTQGAQYSYQVVAQATITVNGTPQLQIAGPSNCVTVTIPNGPSPATGATATAS
jgi:hypothetical protein